MPKRSSERVDIEGESTKRCNNMDGKPGIWRSIVIYRHRHYIGSYTDAEDTRRRRAISRASFHDANRDMAIGAFHEARRTGQERSPTPSQHTSLTLAAPE